MPSPFPGMDPFIESSGRWGDFHLNVLSAMRADLNRRLPKGYTASTDLYVWTQEAEPRSRYRPVEPDVYVHEDDRRRAGKRATGIIAAPSTIVLPRLERRKHRYLKVEDIRAKRVVTVVELLSPSNKKAGSDRALYLEKRSGYLANRISFVEIDLLRGGKRLLLGRRHPEITDYYAMVCRSWEFPEAGFWAFGLRDPFPTIAVPVTSELGDTPLNLRWCADRAYDEGRYSDNLPYDEPLKPRLRGQNVEWVSEVLASRLD